MPIGLFKSLWRDETGEISAISYILVLVILSLGFSVGAVTVRDKLIQEFGDAAVALQTLDQSYSITVMGVTSEFSDSSFSQPISQDGQPEALLVVDPGGSCISTTEPATHEN